MRVHVIGPGMARSHTLDPFDPRRALCGDVLPDVLTEADSNGWACARCRTERRRTAAWAAQYEARSVRDMTAAARSLFQLERHAAQVGSRAMAQMRRDMADRARRERRNALARLSRQAKSASLYLAESAADAARSRDE